jgi:hypothetical protein
MNNKTNTTHKPRVYEYTTEDAGACVVVKAKTSRMKRFEIIAVVSKGANVDGIVERAIWRHKMENKHGNPPSPEGVVDIMSLSSLADAYWTAKETL